MSSGNKYLVESDQVTGIDMEVDKWNLWLYRPGISMDTQLGAIP
jgi:hypothetical protein